VAHKTLRDPEGLALFGRVFDMTGGCRRTHHGFDRAKVSGTMRPLEPRQNGFHGLKSAIDHEAQHSAKASHLPYRDIMMCMAFQSRIEHLRHARPRLEKPRNRQRARILLS